MIVELLVKSFFSILRFKLFPQGWRVDRRNFTPSLSQNGAGTSRFTPIVQAFSRGLLPTMPSADFSPAVNISCLMLSAEKNLRTDDISRGKTRHFHRASAGFTKCIPNAEGGLRGYVPARPECTTPHIQFLFIAPPFWVQRTDRPYLAVTPLPFP